MGMETILQDLVASVRSELTDPAKRRVMEQALAFALQVMLVVLPASSPIRSEVQQVLDWVKETQIIDQSGGTP